MGFSAKTRLACASREARCSSSLPGPIKQSTGLFYDGLRIPSNFMRQTNKDSPYCRQVLVRLCLRGKKDVKQTHPFTTLTSPMTIKQQILYAFFRPILTRKNLYLIIPFLKNTNRFISGIIVDIESIAYHHNFRNKR